MTSFSVSILTCNHNYMHAIQSYVTWKHCQGQLILLAALLKVELLVVWYYRISPSPFNLPSSSSTVYDLFMFNNEVIECLHACKYNIAAVGVLHNAHSNWQGLIYYERYSTKAVLQNLMLAKVICYYQRDPLFSFHNYKYHQLVDIYKLKNYRHHITMRAKLARQKICPAQPYFINTDIFLQWNKSRPWYQRRRKRGKFSPGKIFGYMVCDIFVHVTYSSKQAFWCLCIAT